MATATVTSNVEQPRRGLALPAVHGEGGYFASKNRYDTAWGDLLRAIFTPIGSQPGNRAFGSALHKVLFEPEMPDLPQMVRHVIDTAADRWCPHVRVWKVLVQKTGKVAQLRIVFGLVDEEFLETRLVEVSEGHVKVLGAGT